MEDTKAMTLNNVSLINSTIDDQVVVFLWAKEYALFIKIMVVVTFFLACFGITANCINIRTFVLLGLKDGITVSLLCLSIVDLCYMISYFLLRVVSSLSMLEDIGLLWIPVHPSVFAVFISGITVISSSVGMLSVTFLAVARCLCVSMPLHFKFIFTTRRCVAFNVSFVLITLVAVLPIVAMTRFRYIFIESRNVSRTFIWFTPERDEVKVVVWLIFDTILPILVEATLIVCVIIMTYKLQQSAKFRQSQTGNTKEDTAKESDGKLGKRDQRVVLQVILISVIYIIASIPKIFSAVNTGVNPEFALGKSHQYLYYSISDVRFAAEGINSTVNLFVYLTFNSAFREVCLKHTLRLKSRKV